VWEHSSHSTGGRVSSSLIRQVAIGVLVQAVAVEILLIVVVVHFPVVLVGFLCVDE
jgi:hypothetical protein